MPTFVRSIFYLISLMPRKVIQLLGSLVGVINYYLNTSAAQISRENIELCRPNALSDLVSEKVFLKQSLVQTGKTLMESPAIWFGDADEIDGWIENVNNEAKLKFFLEDSAGLLLLLPHLGNWELFNVFIKRYGQMSALYRPPRRGYLRKVMEKARLKHGNKVVSPTKSGLKHLYKTLHLGGTVVVLPDQVPTSGGFAPFFGHQAYTGLLASKLLKKTGSHVLGVAMVRNPLGLFDAHIVEPDPSIYELDEPTSLKAVNHLMEICVEIEPTQYQWEYKRFKKRPLGARKLYRFNKPPALH